MTVLGNDDADEPGSVGFTALQPLVKQQEFIDIDGPKHRVPPPPQLIDDGEFVHLLGAATTLEEHLIPLRLLVIRKFTEIAALADTALSGPFTTPAIRASFSKLIADCRNVSLETINREGKKHG